jgi:diguanylate cyclase (GGDEF)-like protein/PAS domain S-box-containing protein
MATFDRSGRFVDVNAALAELVGRPREELIGTHGRLLSDDDSIEPELAALRRLVDDGDQVVRYHRELRLASGVPWKGEILLSMVRDAEGEPQLFHLRLTEDGQRRPPERVAWREGDFPLAVDAMTVGVAIIGLDGALLQANRALCEITGRTEAELRACDLLSFTHPDDRDGDIELGTRAWMGEFDSYGIEKRLVRPDGDEVWVHQEVTFARDDEGTLVHLIGQVIDISDRKRVELELARSRQEVGDLVRSMPIGLIATDSRGLITTANPAAAAIVGLDHVPRGFDVVAAVHPPEQQRVLAEVTHRIIEKADFRLEFPIVRPDGSIRWVRSDAHPDYDDQGRFAGISATWIDVTDVKVAEDELRRHASHDSLTGLLNRRMVFDQLADAIDRCEARSGLEGHLTVLFVDLDGFKAVNDAHGHGVGDDLLVEVAARLTGAIDGLAVAGRFGGDEFVVTLDQDDVDATTHGATAEGLADAIVAALARSFTVDGHELSIGASVGIATWTAGVSADDLISAADLGVYSAKRSGRGRWRRV